MPIKNCNPSFNVITKIRNTKSKKLALAIILLEFKKSLIPEPLPCD
jgi:hypothetical protein